MFHISLRTVSHGNEKGLETEQFQELHYYLCNK